jgi:hypothetical protein
MSLLSLRILPLSLFASLLGSKVDTEMKYYAILIRNLNLELITAQIQPQPRSQHPLALSVDLL